MMYSHMDYQQWIMSNTHDLYVPDLTAYIKQEIPESHVKHLGFDPSPFSSPQTYLSDGDDQDSNENLACNTMVKDRLSTEFKSPSPETVLFFEILQEFPDLANFIGHKDSMTFCHLWLGLQQNIFCARRPEHRPRIQSWLKSAALQIHSRLALIVKSNPGNHDITSEPRCMFSAFRRLKDRIEVVHQVLQLIENGRVWFNQTPMQAIEPLVAAASRIKRNVSYFSSHTDAIPILGETSDHVELVDPDKVSLEELSIRAIRTYNMMPYDNAQEKEIDPTYNFQTGYQPDLSADPFNPSVLYMNHALLSHIQPSLVQTSQSLPVTPSCVEQLQYHPFTSLPTSPTCAETSKMTSGDKSLYFDSSFSSETYEWPSPIHTVSEDLPDCSFTKDDDDYIASDTDEEEELAKKKKKTKQKVHHMSRLSISEKQSKQTSLSAVRTRKERTGKSSERKYTRRTATSYDAQTTHYLKNVFFSIYSSRDKLTKEQRRQVQKETGLKPRNITYWFSNHKRRFQASLAVFKRVVNQSDGRVKTYDDFLAWRRNHGLPEEVSEDELNDDSGSC
ncbi:hypothetical protein BD560DRAFT_6787 [Blakeslea trispora]|nr:hypothetical protein BD560DRAFT_6787 [Blakeslea trispora]